ncbi:MAG: hypothetical protein ACOYL3_25025 [Desulfuromonadaceae bacterium]
MPTAGETYNPWRLFVGFFIPNVITRSTELSSTAKLVFGKLCQFAGENGQAYLQALCEYLVVPEWYEPPEVRNARSKEVAEGKSGCHRLHALSLGAKFSTSKKILIAGWRCTVLLRNNKLHLHDFILATSLSFLNDGQIHGQ